MLLQPLCDLHGVLQQRGHSLLPHHPVGGEKALETAGTLRLLQNVKYAMYSVYLSCHYVSDSGQCPYQRLEDSWLPPGSSGLLGQTDELEELSAE